MNARTASLLVLVLMAIGCARQEADIRAEVEDSIKAELRTRYSTYEETLRILRDSLAYYRDAVVDDDGDGIPDAYEAILLQDVGVQPGEDCVIEMSEYSPGESRWLAQYTTSFQAGMLPDSLVRIKWPTWLDVDSIMATRRWRVTISNCVLESPRY